MMYLMFVRDWPLILCCVNAGLKTLHIGNETKQTNESVNMQRYQKERKNCLNQEWDLTLVRKANERDTDRVREGYAM